MLLETPVILVFSLAVAVLLNRDLPARGVVRALFFLPVVIGSGYVIYELSKQGVGGLSVAFGAVPRARRACSRCRAAASRPPPASEAR